MMISTTGPTYSAGKLGVGVRCHGVSHTRSGLVTDTVVLPGSASVLLAVRRRPGLPAELT